MTLQCANKQIKLLPEESQSLFVVLPERIKERITATDNVVVIASC